MNIETTGLKKKLTIAVVIVVVMAAGIGWWWTGSSTTGAESAYKRNGVTKKAEGSRIPPVSRENSAPDSLRIKGAKIPPNSNDLTVSPSQTLSMFHESQKCTDAYRAMQALEGQLKVCEGDSPDSSSCRESRNRVVGELQGLRKEVSGCDGIGTKAFEDLRFEIVANAARAGDVDAQVCYVQSDFDFTGSDKLSERAVAQYKTEAARYVDAALARGDWRVPALLILSGHGLSHTKGLLHSLPLLENDGDLTRYRMMRLLRFGAVGSYASSLDEALAECTQARANGLRGYPPEQLAAADEWARQQYEKSFANSPMLENPPKVCGD